MQKLFQHENKKPKMFEIFVDYFIFFKSLLFKSGLAVYIKSFPTVAW